MVYRRSTDYEKFACLAGKCPDTCCGGWNVGIEEESLEWYASMEGELGKRIRSAIDWEEECFIQKDGHCVLMDKEGLCPIHRELGGDALPDTCPSLLRRGTRARQTCPTRPSSSAPLDRTRKSVYQELQKRREEHRGGTRGAGVWRVIVSHRNKNKCSIIGRRGGLPIITRGDTMIRSFGDKDTERLALGSRVARFAAFERVALRKLRQLQVADALSDLRVPPGNRLEALAGDREGQYSIRINEQFRICFRWTEGGAEHVEIVDYH